MEASGHRVLQIVNSHAVWDQMSVSELPVLDSFRHIDKSGQIYPYLRLYLLIISASSLWPCTRNYTVSGQHHFGHGQALGRLNLASRTQIGRVLRTRFMTLILTILAKVLNFLPVI